LILHFLMVGNVVASALRIHQLSVSSATAKMLTTQSGHSKIAQKRASSGRKA
jgi:hypothetical protein